MELELLDHQLCCPECKELFLKMKNVNVYFDKEGEDGAKIKTVVSRDATATTEVPRGTKEASSVGRRDLMIIEFYCEYCHGSASDETGNEIPSKIPLHKLSLKQYKGMTLVEWK
jgi:hypothetical protein